jgi:hypothetical protein
LYEKTHGQIDRGLSASRRRLEWAAPIRSRLADFDIVRQDRLFVEFHGGVLGELLGVIGACPALDDETAALA